MVRRPLLAALCLVLAAAALVAVAGDASASHGDDPGTDPVQYFRLQPKEFREAGTGLLENWGRDTVLTEHAPDANYQNEQFLNTSALPGKTSEIVLRFPLDQPRHYDTRSPLPANVSINASDGGRTWAWLDLHYRDAMDDDELGRELAVHSLGRPWDEGDLTWDVARGTTDFVSVEPIDTSPAQETFNSRTRSWWVTPYMAEVLTPRSPEPFNGFLVRDANPDDDNCDAPGEECVQEFYSSNWLDRDDDPKGCQAVTVPDTCLPQLRLQVDMNRPGFANMSYSEGFDGRFVGPDVPLNFSVDVWDPVGDLEAVDLEVHHENGTLMLQEDLFHNRSRNLSERKADLPSSFQFWRNASLGFPDGNYTFNLTIGDSDGRWTNTTFRRPNVTVESTEPTITAASVDPDAVDEGGSVDFSMTAEDVYGINATWAVLDHPDLPPIETEHFEPESTVREDGNGTYTFTRSLDLPGTYDVFLKAEDRPGNVRSVRPCDVDPGEPCTIKVNDSKAPTIIESCFVYADRCDSSPAGQEIGGELTFRLRAADNHPTPPDVQLLFNNTDDPQVTDRHLEPERVASGTWTLTVPFEDPDEWPTGAYEARWIVEDPDGNRPDATPVLEFTLDPAQPPQLVEASPEGWGNATPTVTAVLRDVNIAPNRIDLEASVNGEPFERLATDVSSTSTTATVTADVGPLVHRDHVVVRVTATDTFDRNGTDGWEFVVDDRDPRADLGIEGPQVSTFSREVVGLETRISVTGADAESGLDRVEHRLQPRGEEPGDWVPVEGELDVFRNPAYDGPGPYELEYRAVDVAGNEGPAGSVDLYVDTRAPSIQWERGPSAVTVTVRDPGAGVEDVRVFYRNASKAFLELEAVRVQKTPEGGVYEAELPFASEGTRVQVYFTATDALGQTRTLGHPQDPGQRPIRWKQPNHPPVVDVIAPDPGADLVGEVDVVWDARDPDGDPVATDVAVRPVVRDEWQQVADPAGDPGRARWDTTAFPDGRYELRVNARDGRNASHGSVVVDVNNTDLDVAGLSLPGGNLDAGAEVPIEVTIYRPVQRVTATVSVEGGAGGPGETVELRDDGRPPDAEAGDGTFTGTFVPPEAATYTVGLDVLYDDDTTYRTEQVGTFEVQDSVLEQLADHRELVAAAGTILALVAAATVVQLYRYGYI